jgi:hypothetical protein
MGDQIRKLDDRVDFARGAPRGVELAGLSSSRARTRLESLSRVTYKNCMLGDVQTQDDGWGFVVTNERGLALFSLTYQTRPRLRRRIG